MRFKTNTIIIHTPTVKFILAVWERAFKETVSAAYEPECTSGMDGTHSEHSGHYHGRALDFSSSIVPFHLRKNLENRARELLGPDFYIELESHHFHVQRNHDTFHRGLTIHEV
jgi:hypothetical protein